MLDVRTGCRLVETAELEDAKCANRVDWRDKVLITPYFVKDISVHVVLSGSCHRRSARFAPLLTLRRNWPKLVCLRILCGVATFLMPAGLDKSWSGCPIVKF